MEINNIVDYAMHTPENINPVILKQKIEEVGVKPPYVKEFFDKRNNLIRVDIVSDVVRKGAYSDCDSLTEVTMQGVKTIKSNAFSFCYNLRNIHLSDEIEVIENNAFFDVPFDKTNNYNGGQYAGTESNPYLVFLGSFDDGWDIHPDTKVIYSFGNSFYPPSNFIIPDGVTCITDYAFVGISSDITTILLPNNLKYIGLQELTKYFPNLQCTAKDGCKYIGSAQNPYMYCVDIDEQYNASARIFIMDDNTKFWNFYEFRVGSNAELRSSIVEMKITVEMDFINEYDFEGLSSLETLTFTKPVYGINDSAFCSFYTPNLTTINVPWAEGEVAGAPWGATNATINYNYTGS